MPKRLAICWRLAPDCLILSRVSILVWATMSYSLGLLNLDTVKLIKSTYSYEIKLVAHLFMLYLAFLIN